MKESFKQALVLCGSCLFMAGLFGVLANGLCFLLFDSLITFLHYPSLTANYPFSDFDIALMSTIALNPLYMLFPVVFLLFSLPSVLILTGERSLSFWKRFVLLLESHGFFFLLQVLFWAGFTLFTLFGADNILGFLLGNLIQDFDKNLAGIYMPLIFSMLLPLFAIFFVWISVRVSLFLLNDEEQKTAQDRGLDFTGSFTFIPMQAERALLIFDWGNVFLFACVFMLFVPAGLAGYIPHVCTNLMIFFLYFIQHYSTRLHKREKRHSLLLFSIAVSVGFWLYVLAAENFVWQIVFTLYFTAQFYALYLLVRHGKGYFAR